MELLPNMNLDFMKWRRLWVWISFIVIVIGLVAMFTVKRLNMGIDFAGGTQLTLKFRERPDVDGLRNLLEQAGMREAVIQRFGKEAEHSVMLRTPTLAGTEEGSGAKLLAALDAKFNADAGDSFDLNQQGTASVAALLERLNPDGVGATSAGAHYAGVAEAIGTKRKQVGIFTDWGQLADLPGVSAKAVAALKGNARLGDYSVLSLENVGPQVGSELRLRGTLAVIFSLLGMLVYIWFRFELRFGVGAIMASIHDVLVTLGLFAIAGYEFNLTTIAAFLTLVGYSTNDTVVIFDRVRENMRKYRGEALIDLINRSINETLSRTILTGGSTLIGSLALFILGGDVIRGFAFIMVVGVVVGTYSSIYIASPFTLLWERMFPAKGDGRAPARAAGGRPGASPTPPSPVRPDAALPASGGGGKSSPRQRPAGSRRRR